MFIHGNVGEGGFSDFDDFGVFRFSLGVHFYINGDGRVSDLDYSGVETDQVANIDRFFKMKGIDGDRDDTAMGKATGFNRAGNVHIRHYPAAEDITRRISVAGSRVDAQGRLGIGQLGW